MAPRLRQNVRNRRSLSNDESTAGSPALQEQARVEVEEPETPIRGGGRSRGRGRGGRRGGGAPNVDIAPNMVELFAAFLQNLGQGVVPQGPAPPPPPVAAQVVNDQNDYLIQMVKEIRRLGAKDFGGGSDYLNADN
ncbi:hypothetical protein M0R45_002609 [Rubus argutus]|uniref:Uncharacterized protein n=1 Tax=Rubus argutus TaxID=59490 RepID=A0AAW1VN91_RUBAR